MSGNLKKFGCVKKEDGMRLIDGDALIRSVDGNRFITDSIKDYVRLSVNAQPTIEPEWKKGMWLPQDHNNVNGNMSTCVYYLPICSECGKVGDFADAFCKHCGADMRR